VAKSSRGTITRAKPPLSSSSRVVSEMPTSHNHLRSRDSRGQTPQHVCVCCGSSTVRPTLASITGYYLKCGRCDQLWHCVSEPPKPTQDEKSSDRPSVREAIERRAVIFGDQEYELRLAGISEHAEGGATLAISVSGTARVLRFGVSEQLLQDPIALRLRTLYFLKRLLSSDERSSQPTE
jgi:hypothetical protein